MEDKFTKFLKENDAFHEYEHIITNEINHPTTLRELLKRTPADVLLEDGWIFHHLEHDENIDWQELHEKWLEVIDVNE